MERKLRYLEKEIRKDGIPILDTGDNPEAPNPREMVDLEATLEKLENELREVNAYAESLKKNFLELTELKHILRKTQTFFEEALHDQHMTEEAVGLMTEEGMMAGGQAAGLRLHAEDPAAGMAQGGSQLQLVSLRGDGDATRTASDTTAVDGGDSSNNGGSDIGGLKHLQFELAGVGRAKLLNSSMSSSRRELISDCSARMLLRMDSRLGGDCTWSAGWVTGFEVDRGGTPKDSRWIEAAHQRIRGGSRRHIKAFEAAHVFDRGGTPKDSRWIRRHTKGSKAAHDSRKAATKELIESYLRALHELMKSGHGDLHVSGAPLGNFVLPMGAHPALSVQLGHDQSSVEVREAALVAQQGLVHLHSLVVHDPVQLGWRQVADAFQDLAVGVEHPADLGDPVFVEAADGVASIGEDLRDALPQAEQLVLVQRHQRLVGRQRAQPTVQLLLELGQRLVLKVSAHLIGQVGHLGGVLAGLGLGRHQVQPLRRLPGHNRVLRAAVVLQGARPIGLTAGQHAAAGGWGGVADHRQAEVPGGLHLLHGRLVLAPPPGAGQLIRELHLRLEQLAPSTGAGRFCCRLVWPLRVLPDRCCGAGGCGSDMAAAADSSNLLAQEMTLCQLFLQAEAAYACVSELGELGLVQFRDLKPDTNAFQRKFVNEIRRCDEMERKLRYLEKEIRKDGIPILDTGDNPEAPNPREMVDLEATLEKLENELREVNAYAESLKKNFLELTELKHILRKTQTFFEEALHDQHMTEEAVGLMTEEGMMAGGQAAGLRLHAEDPAAGMAQGGSQLQLVSLRGDGDATRTASDTTAVDGGDSSNNGGSDIGGLKHLQFESVAGVILRERLPAFERMLWRAEIDTALEDPATGDKVLKSVFIIFFQGEQLKTRVKKICEGFRATLYPCPDSQAERREMAISVMTRIEDLNTVLNTTVDHRMRVLMAAAKNLRLWFIKVGKIKAIYHTLNMFNVEATNKCLIAEAWCAVDDLDKIHLALRRGTERAGSSIPPILNRMSTREMPPTYFRVNKLTSGFQSIIDAYGVASYREANPSPFAIVTFPFLFAVMYGDFGHGTLMFLAALWMVLREKQLAPTAKLSEIWATFFNGRYIILMMGAFSIYTGLIYNDCFSRSVNIFGSGWSVRGQFNQSLTPDQIRTQVRGIESLQLNPNDAQAKAWRANPYPFGLDPVWQVSGNKITFTNSIKMKTSVVLGVIHMLFGVFVSLTNHLHRRDMLSVVGEFVPQVLFLLGMFGYLVILILYKWAVYSGRNSNCAPNLLIGLINMFLFRYDKATNGCPPIYTGYQGLQTFLVLLIIPCAPWMLLVKPLILRRRQQMLARGGAMMGHQQPQPQMQPDAGVDGGDQTELGMGQQQDGGNNIHDGDKAVDMGAGYGDHGEEVDIGEVFVHQAIHTIEYCLSCISNTASYLRLWALSLAHAQLSEVLWGMVLAIGLKREGFGGCLALFVAFSFWALLTVVVLLLMEGLSAFLHALRLHWVEFMNKFYKGEGYKFEPFSFARAELEM
uniref:V-type proton ATPase subunit a n=1 Tax=Macrostomum lignano TaxID=282301 RepID=A0A1I8JAW3_9PLAT